MLSVVKKKPPTLLNAGGGVEGIKKTEEDYGYTQQSLL
jgi:hypothetical protein